MNKRGLSTIIIAMILIMLSLVAIGVIWVMVRNIISGGTEQIGFEKFTINLKITNAYEQNEDIVVDVKRNTGKGNLTKIKFIIYDNDTSEIITQTSNLVELGTKNFFLSPLELVSTEIVKVSIAPIFRLSDGTESIGGITDTYYLSSESEESENENDGEEEEEEGCVPDCGLRICGPAPNGCEGEDACGPPCVSGTCSADGLSCEGCTPLTCIDLGYSCGTPGDGCGGTLDCGSCPEGQMCQEGTCILITPANTGTVEEIWPGTSGMYFGSTDLPVDISYQEYYIEFPGSEETDCLLIVIYRFPMEGYEKSHIGFNFETSIKTGDSYQIWETLEECQAD